MSTRLAIVRTATALNALVLERIGQPSRPAPGEAPWFASTAAWAITRRPLDGPLADRWVRLSTPRPLDAALLADVAAIMWQTVPDGTRRPPPPALPDAAPPRPRATAAHPRAFRGTKTTPPKAAVPTVADPRRHLRGGGVTAALRARLAPHRDAAIEALVADVRSADDAAAWIDGAMRHPTPALQARHPEIAEADGWSVAFRVAWLPALLAHPWDDIRAVYGAWRRLGASEAMTGAGLALAIEQGPRRAARWFDGLAALPVVDRLFWAQTIAATGVEPEAFEPHTLAELNARIAGPHRHHRIWCLCAHAHAGGSVAYLLQGMDLEDQRVGGPRGLADAPLGVEPAPMDALRRFVERTRTPRAGDEMWRLISLWSSCGALPGLPAILADLGETDLSPQAMLDFADLVIGARYEDTPELVDLKWRWIFRNATRLLDAVGRCPPTWREVAIRTMRLLRIDVDDEAGLERGLERIVGLLAHACAPGTRPTQWLADVLEPLIIGLDDAAFARLLAEGTPCWPHAASAGAEKNHAMLAEAGLEALVEAAPDLLLDAARHAPKPLMRTARLLGSVRSDRAAAITHAVMQDETARRDWSTWPLSELCAALSRWAGPEMPDPVPRKLKQHLDGTAPLKPGQLDRQHQRLLAPSVRVTWLLGRVRDALTRALGHDPATSDASALHARQMVAHIGDNRRILRRVLDAHWRGEDLVRDHPLTRRWWREHPDISEAAWRAPHPMPMPHDPQITLRLEHDPVEVLRMGTYVGSCLGLGGMLPESAAAAAVDDNKRVIYARDPKGRVVARQLVALDESDLLVCFAVYPYGGDPAIDRAFALFDRRLARVLDVELFDPDVDDDYAVAQILSHYWWDDSAGGPGSSRVASRATNARLSAPS